ncbi:hypothetical protein M3O96_21490 [Aquiflexum sp. TKW24L]|uniref:hypothetical protein n=1 Tax=Aquiflexum sp. TKW24L TaxID=2942212 RepID=UPI0020BF245D|nr:hypothetical protein [Aquiflexum sp. TKW24L]MCL6261683.1 hypothetical protein [Aquiflexum sp. TKW24L]
MNEAKVLHSDNVCASSKFPGYPASPEAGYFLLPQLTRWYRNGRGSVILLLQKLNISFTEWLPARTPGAQR